MMLNCILKKYETVNLIELAQDTVAWRAFLATVMGLQVA
jgi:hypothetical protein